MKGLLIGAAVAAAVIGAAVWAQAQQDNSIDSRDLLLNDWGLDNGITVMIPNNRAVTPIEYGNSSKAVSVVGSSANVHYLIYFPSTDTLHVNATGYPIDAIATASWHTYSASKRVGIPADSAREASQAPTINWVPPFGTNV